MVSHAPGWLIDEVRRAKRGWGTEKIEHTRHLLERYNLNTVCQTALCPNRGECFSGHTATFMILGEICTRSCSFCAVNHGHPLGSPDEDEPEHLAQAVKYLGLNYVVVTSVTRDDLLDGGAHHYARVVETLKRSDNGVKVELLVPDFRGSMENLSIVLASNPDVLAHNIETVPRLYPSIRKGADYRRSLTLLKRAKSISSNIITKSGLMLGLGEEDSEVEQTLKDLYETGCDMLTLGQYLSPSLEHEPIVRYVTPKEFGLWHHKALKIGFKSVAAGPLVRSSYKAGMFFGDMK